MLTGLYPFHHGAEARRDPETGEIHDAVPLRRDLATLAEALGRVGYQTAAVVANGGYLRVDFGLDRGFEQYSEKPKSDGDPRRGPDVNASAIAILERRDRARPFFLLLNYMDAHRPYNVGPLPPERAARLPQPDPMKPSALLDELVMAVLEEEDPPEPELVERVVTQYDYGIAHGDLAIEGLVDWLEQAGEWQDTLLIVTSDHGEYLGEHDLVEHSKDIYEEGLRVPLVVRRPGQRKGRVIEEPISLVEIPCLVLGELPASARARLEGTFPCGAGADRSFAELRYTRSKDLRAHYGARFRRERTAMYFGPWKLLRSTDGEHELYDLEQDPRETTNLFRVGEDLSQRLLGEVEAVRERADAGALDLAPPELDAETLEELRNLGYVGGLE
jgi:arylsulfatase A-like enzyme